MYKRFVCGVVVFDYNFIGREVGTNQLMDNFRGGINIILMSPRRLGKISLVMRVCEKTKSEGITTIYLDIFGCKSEYDFYNRLASEVLKQTASKQSMWPEEAKEFLYRLTPEISFSPEPNNDSVISSDITPKTHTPEEVLEMVEKIAVKRGKQIVVCTDRSQQIGEMTDSKHIQARLRSVQQRQKHVSYCPFGSKHHLMNSIFLHRSMPFHQFGDPVVLGKIPSAEWAEYIISHFADGKRTISSALAEEICSFTDDYSAYVQQLSWLAYTQKEEGETVDEIDIKQATDGLLATNEVLFMQMIEPLPEYQLNFLHALCSGVTKNFGLAKIREKYQPGSHSSTSRLQKALFDRDSIEKHGMELAITDPVLAKWL